MKTSTNFGFKWMIMAGMFLFLHLLGGCQDEELPDEVRTLNDAYKVIVGEWEWVRSVYLEWGGRTVKTPESERTTRGYVFRKDRSMQRIENGTVMWSAEYRLEPSEEYFFLWVDESGGSLTMSFRKDTLIFHNRPLGHSHVYLRK